MKLLKSSSLAVIGLIVCLLITGCAKSRMRQAVLAGDINTVEKILQSHSDRANERDPSGDTLLHMATRKGDQQMVNVLLQYGADVEAKNDRDETPLEIAACEGSASIMRTLLSKGAKIRDPRMLLRRAAWGGHVDVAQILLERGTEINVTAETQQGGERSTPLHAAVIANRPDMVEFLVAHGADVNATDSVRRTPLHLAAESLYTQIAKTLLAHGSKVNAESKTGETPLHRAAQFGSMKMVELLLSQGATANPKGPDGQTPLDVAVMAREVETVNTLRKLGGKPSEQWELFDAVMLHEIGTIDRILTARPSAGTEMANGYTPLHLASRHGHMDCAKALLEHKINVDIRGFVKQTPLHVAAQSGDKEMARLLLDHGAEINARDRDGLTPLSYLYKFCSPIRPPGGGPVPLEAKYKPIEQLLLTRGAKE